MSNAENKLEVDDDWKAQAQREKEQLAGGAKPAEARPAAAPASPSAAPAAEKSPPAARHDLPPASFEFIVEQYVTQVLLALGAIEHPASGKRQRDLELAKHYIDMLAVLEEKTKGNLTKEEEQLLATALYQMRMNYVNASRGAR